MIHGAKLRDRNKTEYVSDEDIPIFNINFKWYRRGNVLEDLQLHTINFLFPLVYLFCRFPMIKRVIADKWFYYQTHPWIFVPSFPKCFRNEMTYGPTWEFSSSTALFRQLDQNSLFFILYSKVEQYIACTDVGLEHLAGAWVYTSGSTIAGVEQTARLFIKSSVWCSIIPLKACLHFDKISFLIWLHD